MSTPTAAAPWHPPHELPESHIILLCRFGKQCYHQYSIWPGYHDGSVFRDADGFLFQCDPIGWMHLEEAAALIDAAKP